MGRELLGRAHALAPLLARLPATPPTTTIISLLITPFLAALRRALASLIASPGAFSSAYVDEAASDAHHKRYQQLTSHGAGAHNSGGNNAAAAAHSSSLLARKAAQGAARSPMTLLSFVYEDATAFVEAVRAACLKFGGDVPSHIGTRLVDAVFLERESALQAMISQYVMGAVEVRPQHDSVKSGVQVLLQLSASVCCTFVLVGVSKMHCTM